MTADSIQKAWDTAMLAVQPTNLALEGVRHEIVGMTPYVSTRMSGLDRIAVGAGQDGALRWTGIYQINVHYPTGAGLVPVLTKVSEIMAAFRRGTTITTSDNLSIRCEAPKTAPRIEVAPWLTAPVMVPWFCYEMPTS